MKTKKGFRLRNICGENIIVAEGVENIDFSRIISMNESSAYLWKKVEGQDFTEKDLTDYLTEEYDVDEETAQKDVTTLIAKWLDAGIISKSFSVLSKLPKKRVLLIYSLQAGLERFLKHHFFGEHSFEM